MRDHLNRKFERLALEDELTLETCLHFMKRIQEVPLPQNFKMSTLVSYDGTTNPIVHLTNYNMTMKISRVETDEAKCLTFPVILSGWAMTWFVQLKLGSIENFKELAFAFTNDFISSRR